ncbi:cadherin domain-containing protein, partial [Geitlerinema sp. PCC 9228]|uniref:cadherin domain-containing protein n=1 Tax=Geitlerinema sp. PCC 9228 TaxID=111611 RepID=UPI000A468CFB
SLPNHGTLSLNGIPLAVGETFTQQDIDSSNLVYQHDGSKDPNIDNFDFALIENGTTAIVDTFAIAISEVEVNNPPEVAAATFNIDENSSQGTLVGTVTAIDPENDPLQNWQIISNADPNGNGIPAFSINPDTGEIAVGDTEDLDFESNPSFDLQVQVSDSNATSDPQPVTVNLKDLPEATNNPPSIDNISIAATPDASGTIALTSQFFTNVFTDPEGSPLAGIRIDSLPENSNLLLNGETISAPEAIAAADISQLSVRVDSDFTGTLAFDWNASDGELFAPSSKTFTIDVGNTTTGGEQFPTSPPSSVPSPNPSSIEIIAGGNLQTPFNTAIALENITLNATDNNMITVTTNTSNGTLTLDPTPNINFLSGDGDNDSQFVVAGSPTSLDAALDGLIFTPNAGFFGETTVELTASNGGVSDTDTVSIRVLEPIIPNSDRCPVEIVTEITTVPVTNGTIAGNGGDEVLQGSDRSDRIEADSGNDVLLGGAAEDILLGGSGDDTFRGGRDRDLAFGESGNDLIQGDLGSDILNGGVGNDVLLGDSSLAANGGETGETVLNSPQADLLVGGDGRDFLFGDVDSDTLLGGTGSDTLLGGSGDDQLVGNAGNDSVSGDLGSDTIVGNTGDDTLIGDSGNDFLCAGDGDDWVLASQGADELAGGAGNDTLFGGVDGDIVFGDAGDDVLLGDLGNNLLFGGSGNDVFVLSTNTGVDTIADFTDGLDTLGLAGGLQFSQLTVVATDTGAAILLGEQVLANVLGGKASHLTEADFREFAGF